MIKQIILRLTKIFLPLFFFLLSFYPAFGIFNQGQVSQENRNLVKMPRLAFDRSLLAFPEKFDAYVNDHFYLREQLIIGQNVLNYRVFAHSDVPKVFVGKEGWLFGRDGILKTYAAAKPFTEKELNRWTEYLAQTHDRLAAQGRDYYFFVSPDKSSIYPEYAPLFAIKINEVGRYEQLLQKVDAEKIPSFVETKQLFFDHKQDRRLYFKFDTHWNNYGAFLLYQKLAVVMKTEYPSITVLGLSDFTEEYREFNERHDLASSLSLKDVLAENDIDLVLTHPRAELMQDDGQDFKHYQTNDETLPTILVIGDSFMRYAMNPLLAENAHHLYYVNGPFDKLPQSLIDTYDPDIVIQEFVEKKLYDRNNLPAKS